VATLIASKEKRAITIKVTIAVIRPLDLIEMALVENLWAKGHCNLGVFWAVWISYLYLTTEYAEYTEW